MTDHWESVGKWISVIDRYGQIYQAEQFAHYDLGVVHIRTLLFLYRKNGVSQETIARQLCVDKGTATRTIHKLETKGYVIRQIDSHDKRVKRVYLTKNAMQIKPEIKSILKQWTDTLTQRFSKRQKEELLHFLRQLAENAVEAIQEYKEDQD